MPDLVRYIGTRKLRWQLLYIVRFLFRLFGGSWNSFYAYLLDFQDRRITLDQILARPSNPRKFKGLWDWRRGQYYLGYMKAHGVKPTDTVLDYGCGYGRVVIPLLKFQEPGGKCIGTEISAKRLQLAKEWIKREGLTAKDCELVLSQDTEMPFIRTDSVDVIWVLSVFNHMPDKELNEVLAAMHRVLKPTGMLFCYYVVPEPGAAETAKTFRRSQDEMTRILAAHGFSPQVQSDWDDDLGSARKSESRMQICRKLAA